MTIKVFKAPSFFEARFIDSASGCERRHTHSSLIISAVLQGNISLQINRTDIQLKKGMIAAIGPNVPHCVRSYSPEFAGVYVLEIFKLLPINDQKFDESHFHIFGTRLVQEKERINSFINLCEILLSHTAADREKFELCADWLHDLFVCHFSKYPFQIPESSKPNGLAAKIKSILDESNEESPPHDHIAQACGYTREHRNRMFKQAYNLSIQTYFLNKKAAMARDLLSSGKELAEIALLCGFYDQSHLTRVFRDIYQVSPRKYREAVYGTCHSHTR